MLYYTVNSFVQFRTTARKLKLTQHRQQTSSNVSCVMWCLLLNWLLHNHVAATPTLKSTTGSDPLPPPTVEAVLLYHHVSTIGCRLSRPYSSVSEFLSHSEITCLKITRPHLRTRGIYGLLESGAYRPTRYRIRTRLLQLYRARNVVPLIHQSAHRRWPLHE